MNLVFVHLDSKVPDYLLSNINYICSTFPDHQIVLITNRPFDTDIKYSNFSMSFIKYDDVYNQIECNLKHPKEFRSNFWFTSLARLLAISDFVINENAPVLHIESDTLLSKDFPVRKFMHLDRPIAYTMIGRGQGVASVMWIENKDAAECLKKYIYVKVKSDSMTTDMRILGAFKIAYPQLVRILASFPWNKAICNSPLEEYILEDFNYTLRLFDGYFDGADIGQFLFGDDARNHRGIKYLRKELQTSYLQPSSLQYFFSQHRSFVNFSSDESSRLYSLHIHSKNPKLFRNGRSKAVLRKGVINQNKPEEGVFLVNIFLQSVKISMKRRLLQRKNANEC